MYDCWDLDHNGSLDYKELDRAVRGAKPPPAGKSRRDSTGASAVDIQKALNERLQGKAKGGAAARPGMKTAADVGIGANKLKRGKMWLQLGEPKTDGFVKYYYTGWQRAVLPATSDVAPRKLIEGVLLVLLA